MFYYMKFYNRTSELQYLSAIQKGDESSLCYLIGRRRIGKTSLIEQFFLNSQQKYLYLFVGNKKIGNLLQSFNESISSFIWFSVVFKTIRDMLQFLMEYSLQHPWTHIVFDEFQNFYHIDEWVYSDIQELRDRNKKKWTIRIYALWSISTLMQKVFQDKWSPLYGRATHMLDIREFNIQTIKEILSDYKLYTPENLLHCYTLFGWVPKYYEVLDSIQVKDNDLLTTLINTYYVKENSLLLNEGEDLLMSEFGKTSPVYYSILESIANGQNKRSEIANYTGINYDSLGFYLEQLESQHGYIEKIEPIVSKIKSQFYRISVNFLQFRFRYIYKRNNLIQIKRYDLLQQYIADTLSTYEWIVFEKLIKECLIDKNQRRSWIINFDHIGTYRDKSNNEIDIVAYDSKKKEVAFVECKVDVHKITQWVKDTLIKKTASIAFFSEYKKYYCYYSLNDVEGLLG